MAGPIQDEILVLRLLAPYQSVDTLQPDGAHVVLHDLRHILQVAHLPAALAVDIVQIDTVQLSAVDSVVLYQDGNRCSACQLFHATSRRQTEDTVGRSSHQVLAVMLHILTGVSDAWHLHESHPFLMEQAVVGAGIDLAAHTLDGQDVARQSFVRRKSGQGRWYLYGEDTVAPHNCPLWS